VKKVFVSHNLDEAYRVRDLLRTEGIAAEVTNEPLIGAFGSVPMDISTLPTVWIADDGRADEADALVERALQPASKESWSCAKCGERLGGQFTHCPMCGTERP